MRVDLAAFEMHNVVKRGARMFTRSGLRSLATPTAGTRNVAAFTVESPFTTEPWHYVFEQSTTTRVVTMRVHTEEFSQVFAYDLGVMQRDPVITHAIVDNQLVINSPSFSTPLYGAVGGGVFALERLESEESDYEAIDPPPGLAASLGNRVVIAQANALYVNRARTDGDPRTFIGENAIALSGTVYDLFEGPDGALYVFTSKDVQVIPRDIIATDRVQPSASAIAGISTSRPKNAIATGGVIAVLQKDGFALLSGSAVSRVPLTSYRGKRTFSRAIEQDDLRIAGELHATADGFLIGFRGARGFFVEVNLREDFTSATWLSEGTACNVVGTLRGRGGETLIVLQDRVVMQQGGADFDGSPIRGVLCGRVVVPTGGRPKIRRVTTSSANVGQPVAVAVAGEVATKSVPTRADDAVVGVATWDSNAPYTGRDLRTVRCSFDVRRSEADVEVMVAGADRRIGPAIEVETTGQGRDRKDRQ